MMKVTVVAQQDDHEFSVYAGGGLSSLHYKLTEGKGGGGGGGDFGLGYTYTHSIEKVTGTGKVYRQQWGVFTGLGFGVYNGKAKLNDVQTVTTGLTDGEKEYDRFDMYSTLSGYTEHQNTVYLHIPVMAKFQIDQYYVMGGFKMGIPLNGKYQTRNATLTNRAYYRDLNNWAETQEFVGLGKYNLKRSNGDLDMSMFVALSLEGGIKWELGDNFSLYTGLYFDIGLNNVAKSGYQPFMDYRPGSQSHPENFSLTTNSALTSYTDDSQLAPFTNKVNMMAVGVKVRLAYLK